MYDTRRTATWERYALALNGFHGRVLRSLRYRSNSQSDFFGKGPLFLERVTIILVLACSKRAFKQLLTDNRLGRNDAVGKMGGSIWTKVPVLKVHVHKTYDTNIVVS